MGIECKKVIIGECDLYHPDCKNGVSCTFLQRRKCTRFHPKEHFNQTQTKYEEQKRIEEARSQVAARLAELRGLYCSYIYDF